jgi:CheY-like chemotaxis protein
MKLMSTPQQPMATPAIPAPSEKQLLEGRRILLVEDNTDSRTALALLLSRAGANVTSVDSAEAALSATGLFDLLLSDIGLPDRDGCELMRELRTRPDWTDKPAIAISAYAQPEDKVRAAEAGFSDFVSKPVDPEGLMHLLADKFTVTAA